MKTEITATCWNTNALLGWFALVVGLLGVMIQLLVGVNSMVWLSVFGIVGGGLILSLSGPTKR